MVLLTVLFTVTTWGAMPDGYTFYTTTNGVSTAFTALPEAYRCAIGIAWNSTKRTSSSNPTEIGAGISTDYQGPFIIPSFLKDQAYSVTEIGYKAFCKCEGITGVTIPSSIRYIDYNAFYGCYGLTEVTIPGSIATIDGYAFACCHNLKTINLKEGIQTIGENAFLACKSLTTLEIPASVKIIGSKAFGGAQINHNNYGYGSYEGCDNLTKVIVHWDEPITISSGTFSNAANCILYVPKGTVEKYANADVWKEFKSIKESPIMFADSSVKTICISYWDMDGDGELSEDEAAAVTSLGTIFRKKSITSFDELKFFTGLTSIGSEEFEKCYSLTSIEIPQNVTSISNQAFKECSSLTSINIPGKVESIGSRAFEGCNNLTKVIVEDIISWCNLVCYDNPLNRAHHLYSDNNTEIKDLVIPNGVTSLWAGAFSGCSELTSITIPASVNNIAGTPFSGCLNLTMINIDSNNETYESPAGSKSIIEKSTKTLVAGCENSIIPNGVVSIGTSAFLGCSSLSSIEIPNSVQSIGASSFSGCNNLSSIEIPNSVQSIGAFAFQGCNFKSVIINGPASIGEKAFYGCNSLQSVTLSNIKSIGVSTFEGCSALTSIDLPNTITSIGGLAFQNCTSLSSIVIPRSVTSVGGSVFYGCTGLESATIEGTTVGYQQFYGCKNLESIVLSNNVTSIGNNAFIGCTSLTSVNIPRSVSSIGSAAFNNCSNLLLVVSENEDPTNINDIAFVGISSNARLQVPVGTKSKYQAITGWSRYFKEIVDDGNTPEVLTLTIQVDGLGTVHYDGVSIRNKVSPFYILEGNSATLSFNAENANGLKSVKVNDVDVTSNIANNQYTTEAITSNSIIEVKFEYPELTDGQTFVEGYSYGSITYRVISVNDKICEVYLAYSDEDDGDFIIPSSIYGYKVIGIAQYAFEDEDDMETITIPPTITYIEKGAFDEGGTVSDVYISDLKAWCNISFADSYSAPNNGGNLYLNGKIIKNLIIPNSITEISNYTFRGCSCIQSVLIHNGVNAIGTGAFSGCNSLSTVTVLVNNPISIDATTFTNRINATLYVPYGSKSAYEVADYWKDFKEIIEMPGLTLNDQTICKGGKIKLPVSMENEEEITAFQFDVEIPQGVTLTDVQLGKRSSDSHTVDFSKQADGSYRVIAVSLQKAPFNGNEGELVNLMLSAENDIEGGDYNISINNIVLTTTTKEKIYPKDVNSVLTVLNVKQGDADGDGFVDVADVVTMVDYILDNSMPDIIFSAADMNGDGEIDIFDVMIAINIILNRDNSAGSRTRASGNMEEQAIVTATADGSLLGINDAGRFTAFQFDVEVADGMELTEARLNGNAGNHKLYFLKNGQNTYRVISVSMDNSTLTNCENDLVRLSFSQDGHIQISNIVFVTPQKSKVYFASGDGEVTGIGSIRYEQAEEIFDLSGRKVNSDSSRLPKGVYIINNKKVVIK